MRRRKSGKIPRRHKKVHDKKNVSLILVAVAAAGAGADTAAAAAVAVAASVTSRAVVKRQGKYVR